MSRWSDKLLQKKNKYGAKKVSTDGYSFASKLEAALYQQLKLELAAGVWSSIQVQDHVYLTDARILYIADFRCVYAHNGKPEWYEAKGYETDVWRIKRRLWKHYGPGNLQVYKGRVGNIYLDETIIPK